MKKEESFIFYEYLSFFWRKKWLIVLIPLVFCLLAVGLSYLGNKPYVGSATVYPGTIKKESLLQAELIKGVLQKEVSDKINFNVNNNADKVVIQVINPNEETVKTSIEEVTDAYMSMVNEEYERLSTYTEQKVAILEKRISSTEKSIETLEGEFQTPNVDVESEGRNLGLIGTKQERLFELMAYSLEKENDLMALDSPILISQQVTQEKANVKSNVIVGLVLGLFLTMVLLTLWKYINDARNAKSQVM